jgi:hypothetical protein
MPAMSASRQLVVRSVESKADWRVFFGLADEMNRHDKNYVRPLNGMRQILLDTKQHPFYQHAERQALICWDGTRAVGRIAAIVDHLHQQHYSDRTGFFGFFESVKDTAVARTLLEAAANWLVARGCDAARGPVNPSMKNEFGVLVEGNQYPPYALMAHTPSYYHDLLTHCGFEVVRTFLAFALHESDDRHAYEEGWKKYDALCRRVHERYPQIQIRPVDSKNLAEDIRRINQLGDQVRNVGWGYVPFTEAELDFNLRKLRRILRPGMIYIAEVDQQVAGYAMMIPDLNWALHRTVGRADWLRMIQLPMLISRTRRTRIMGLGVAPQYRSTGLAGLLIRRMFQDWGEHFRGWELSWIDSENVQSVRATTGFLPVKEYKKYHLYQRSIA